MRYGAISAVRSDPAMGITVVCQSCGSRRTVPAHLYDEKIRGKVVKIACRGCGQMISVDGTIPPPPAADTPITEDLMNLLIPEVAKLPSEHQPSGSEAGAPPGRTDTKTAQQVTDDAPAGDGASAPREKQISHVDGPISERGPSYTVGRYALFEQFA